MNTTNLAEDERNIAIQKQEAFQRLNHAWQEALTAGIEPDVVAHAALFAARSDLVESYGEDAVADYTPRLAERVNRGEFSLPDRLN